MSRQTTSRDRRGCRREREFRAPLGRTVKMVTGGSVLLLALLMGVPPLVWSRPGPLWPGWLAPGLVVLTFGVLWLFSVRGYVVHGREFSIRRPLWQTRFTLQGLRSAYADPEAMRQSWRTAGNGGLFVFCGWFRNKRLGSYRAYVTDLNRCVVLQFRDRILVVSPDDPEAFVTELGFGTDTKPHAH